MLIIHGIVRLAMINIQERALCQVHDKLIPSNQRTEIKIHNLNRG
jgi:hypothetical protein